MTAKRTRWLLASVLCLAVWPVQTLAQRATLEQHMRAGVAAYRQGDYAEAEKQWNAGLGIAEAFGTQDPRYATSLNNLATLYRAQGRYGAAEPLYIGIMEKTLGPAHSNVATSLNNLEELYRVQGRYGDVEPLYKRSLGLWEKTLGPDAQSLENYAALLRKTGGDAQAARMEARVKNIRSKHPEWTARFR